MRKYLLIASVVAILLGYHEVQAANFLSNGLVGYWSLDGKNTIWTSSTAGTTNDLSGNGNTGTLTNMNITTAPIVGKVGQALSFNGSNFVDAGTSSTLNPSSAISAFLWVYPTAITNPWEVVLARWTTDLSYHFSFLDGSSGLSPTIYLNPSGGVQHVSSSISAPLNKWSYIGFIWANDVLTIYVNGVSGGSVGTSGTIAANTDNTVIGDKLNLFFPFVGTIDDVRIYNRGLSPAEVVQLYRYTLSRRSRY